jgi:hypothetical protein
MDNLIFANGAPPEKLNFQGCTPGYPASRSIPEETGPPIPFFQGKVAQFESESVDHFTTECLVRFAPEQVAHFAAESVVGFHRNPHYLLKTTARYVFLVILTQKYRKF